MHGVSLGEVDEKNGLKFCLFSIILGKDKDIDFNLCGCYVTVLYIWCCWNKKGFMNCHSFVCKHHIINTFNAIYLLPDVYMIICTAG
jgi:hypothetical protein